MKCGLFVVTLTLGGLFAGLSASLFVGLSGGVVMADDWPMWRGDARRSGDWQGTLAEKLHPLWIRDLPPLEPAYHHPRLHFDAGYEPIVVGDRLIVGSSRNDRVTAFDTVTGDEAWRFYTAGPIRFAPVGFEANVYFGSDDGYLYCLDLASGALVWKFQAVPSNRKVLGNRRLISVWPVRGGPVVADGTIYFAAGVWSFEGVFIYALDAATGDVKWVNDRTGFLYGQHPHDAKAFGGVTPQGYLVAGDDELIVPCGTALPAIFDRQTGELKSFELPKAGRSPGGWFTAAAKAKRRGQPVPEGVEDDADESLADRLLLDTSVNRDLHENGWHQGPGNTDARSRVTINGKVVDFAAGYPGVEGQVYSVVAGGGRLFVVTIQGRIYAFGDEPVQVRHFAAEDSPNLDSDDRETDERVASILRASGAMQGHAIVAGIGDGRLIERLARRSELQIIAIDPDADKCDTLRRRLDASGLLGTRVSVHHGDPLGLGLPPYLATLVVSDDLSTLRLDSDAHAYSRLFQVLRPFGGVACLELSADQQQQVADRVAASERQKLDGQRGDIAGDTLENMDGAELRLSDRWALLGRPGGLAGATDYVGGWTSPDERVKAPLGVLWFDDSVSHFKRAPQPMFVDGVMISYDKDWKGWTDGKRPPYRLLPPTYSDIYTGRVLTPAESTAAAVRLPTRDLNATQDQQYRPPTQTNAWNPAPPVAGERFNPLTGQTEPRAFPKSYGCDGGIDYQLMYTMRSGTAAFYDKRLDSGTIHISGPRSGCTNSIIPAGGLLNVPYFYQGCTCSYPLPLGLAMYSLPADHEQWAVWGEGKPQSIRRLGLNFGAPGARMTEAGTLWLEHPQVGGPAPEILVTTEPEMPRAFYRHSIWISGGVGWPWVAASGVEGVSSLTVSGLSDDEMTVRLYFAEPVDASRLRAMDASPAEPRIFDVAIQGKVVMKDFDIANEAGGVMRGVVKEFANIQTDGTIKIDLVAKQGEPILCGLELVAVGLPQDDLTSRK